MRFKVIAVFGMALTVFLLAGSDASAQVPRMNKEELKGMLGSADVVVIDVRQPAQWDGTDLKILGAHREDPGKKAESWVAKYPKHKTIVLYWTWHNEATSARVAQEMISLGYHHVYALQGGWDEWLAAGFPTEKK
jgi:3-mercaptopyruvate sulfurtransferase SseA